jgi:cytochrome c biogenesis protein CcdA
MILQAAIGAGIGILVFGGLAFLIFTPLMSMFTYNALEWIILKSSSSDRELKGRKKIIALVGSVILGIIFAFVLTCFVFWLFFRDVTFD